MDDKPAKVHSNRTEILQRLLREECEICGSTENCEVHHVRKISNLNKLGQREKPIWVKRMVARQRKTLVVCFKCHRNIHSGKPVNTKVTE